MNRARCTDSKNDENDDIAFAGRLIPSCKEYRREAAMRLSAMTIGFIAVGAALVEACAPAEDTDDDPSGTLQTAQPLLMATTDPDTSSTGVVMVRSLNEYNGTCSGTLIAPNVVLTAAHCFARFANGCLPVNANVGFAADGLSPGVSIQVADVAIAPSAYAFSAAECQAAGGSINCSALHLPRSGNDLALLRLTTNAPAGIQPIPVLTSIRDNVSPNSSCVHRTLDSNSSFTNPNSPPSLRAVGFGNSTPCNGTRRRSGPVALESAGPAATDWRRGCQEHVGCFGGTHDPPLFCSKQQFYSYSFAPGNLYDSDQIRVHRINTSGPVPTNGDSGGPLLYDEPGGNPGTYIIGTVSEGEGAGTAGCQDGSPPVEQDLQSIYTAPFTTENGLWIEKTLEYWSGTDYANRIHGWHTSVDDLGQPNAGGVQSSPGAASQGNNLIDVYFRGADSKLWQKWYNPCCGWSFYGPITHDIITSSPSAVSWSPGRADVVARSASGSVLHWYYSGGWSVHDIGGWIPSWTGPAIASGGPDRLSIFAVGGDATLYWKSWVGSWTAWLRVENLAGSLATNLTSSPAAVAWAPRPVVGEMGRVDVFAQRSDGAIVHVKRENGELGWEYEVTAASNYGVAPGSGVSVSSWAPGRLDVVARDASNPSAMKWWSRGPAGWTQPATIITGGLPGSTPGIVAQRPGRLDLFSRGTSSSPSLLHWWYPGP